MSTPEAIRPEIDTPGDMRIIRNDLVHNDGVAGERCADCRVLRWFEPDDRIHLTLSHVFDFLNQMGWMARSPIHVEADRVVVWLPFQDDLGPAAETPRIASVRPLVVEPHESGFRYGFSVVFEDGMFGQVAVLTDGMSMDDERWRAIRVNQAGGVHVPPDTVIAARRVYEWMFAPTTKGPGSYSPPLRFR